LFLELLDQRGHLQPGMLLAQGHDRLLRLGAERPGLAFVAADLWNQRFEALLLVLVIPAFKRARRVISCPPRQLRGQSQRVPEAVALGFGLFNPAHRAVARERFVFPGIFGFESCRLNSWLAPYARPGPDPTNRVCGGCHRHFFRYPFPWEAHLD
jgi:hypothetical protein